MDPQTIATILQALTPVIVLAAAWMVNKVIKPVLPGWLIPLAIVPLLSAVYTYLSALIAPGGGLAWYFQLVLGFVATWIHQIKVQFSK